MERVPTSLDAKDVTARYRTIVRSASLRIVECAALLALVRCDLGHAQRQYQMVSS